MLKMEASQAQAVRISSTHVNNTQFLQTEIVPLETQFPGPRVTAPHDKEELR